MQTRAYSSIKIWSVNIMSYEHLLSPYKIGNLELKNRMIVSSAVTRLCNADGTVSEGFIRYQEDKARGGWALIMTEDLPIMEGHVTYSNLPAFWDDSFMPGHIEMVKRVHAAGAKMGAQLYHPGRDAKEKIGGKYPVAPSAVRCRLSFAPRELTKAEIDEIRVAFGKAALRAKNCGYDLVEIHAAHGYLIHQFLSARTNKRNDEYGGSLYNRNRFLLEVIAEVRKAVGPDFPLSVRINGSDYMNDGITPREAVYTAKLVEEAGADVIHCSQGSQDSFYAIIPPAAAGRAPYVGNAEEVKKAVHIPVIAVGRINEPGLAESIIASGIADFVTMFRASLADPELPNKVRDGRIDEIAYCIGCLQGCRGQNAKEQPFTCLVRPMTGHAHEYEIKPVEQPKNVAVIGGGIAGCEAAIIAAQRGHHVTIYEQSNELGGRWIAASIPPGKSEYNSFLYWQKVMLSKYGVNVELNTTIDAEKLKAIKPDAVIVATGARDMVPPIPGHDNSNVVFAQDVLRERVEYGHNVVVIGGGLVGAETADYLSEYGGRKVSIIEMMPEIVRDGEPNPTWYLMRDFKNDGVDIYTSANVTEIGDGYVRFKHEGVDKEIAADTVVMATGLRPDAGFAESIKALGIPTIVAGDASSGKNGFQNIREGFMAGLNV